MKVRTVCIVGAGVSGITAVKSCLEEGLEPICFERSCGVGGIWYTDDEYTRKDYNFTFDSLIANTSKEMMCMSDFPYPEEVPPFPTPRHIQQYWKDYTKHFGLMKYIRLNQNVVNISSIGSGRWKIITKNVDGDIPETEVDALIVASGLQGEINMPDIPGRQEFTGEVLHSKEFRRGTDWVDKTVVVVGAAFSAGDTSVDCSRHCKMTYLSTRRGFWVLRRILKGRPWDSTILSRWFNYMPLSMQQLYLETTMRAAVNHKDLGFESDARMYSGASVMINDSINDQILCGKLKMKPQIEMLTKNGVVFEDGSRVDDVDVVILATGYNKYYPYLEDKAMRESLEEKFDLYKYMFIPGKPTFAAIGLAKALGPQGTIYELQSRWAARIFSGKCELPSIDVMKKDIRAVSQASIQATGSVHSYILWTPYVLDIAQQFGCLPNATSYLFTNPRVAMKIAFGTVSPYTFRLMGPHSWDGAMDALLDSPRRMLKPTKTRVSKVPYKNIFHTLAQVVIVLLVLFLGLMLKLFILN